ncbi:hypothetical protein [Streptomyces cavernicola]|uniref:Uncharacterized protein n=1 Tax=Streptomyces cavernicola TaxID=3043613 RepID=A0ABT6SAG7_9ACTN|nr:hypothetical protein [Streptomyces sp. B-S-A6]MDI3405177.1 hypothetical protein [Streptomyces sp. B-S-A6]
MSDLNDVAPRLLRRLESRNLFLRAPEPAPADPPHQIVIQVCWKDGIDEYGLPVGHMIRTRYRRGLMGRIVEHWAAHATTDPRLSGRPEVAARLHDINDALGAVLDHIHPRYS